MEKTYKRQVMLFHVVDSAEATAKVVELDIKPGNLPSDNFISVAQLRIKATGIQRADVVSQYDVATGILSIESATMALDDEITVTGTYL